MWNLNKNANESNATKTCLIIDIKTKRQVLLWYQKFYHLRASI